MKNKATDIVFIEQPSRIITRKYPLTLMTLSSYISEKGYDNIITNPYSYKKNRFFQDASKKLINEIRQKMVRDVIKMKPKIILLSSFTSDFLETVSLVEQIKKHIDVIAIVGGHHANVRPQDFFDYNVDFAVVGEGEETLLELINMIYSKKKNFQKIKGLAWKSKNKVIINKPRELMKSLDNLPMPAYDKIDLTPYVQMWDGQIRGVPLKAGTIMTGRGCPYACSFCSCNKVFGRNVRYMSLDMIEKEVDYLVKNYGIEGLWVVDDTFTLNKKRMAQVAKIFQKYNLIWSAQARVNLVDEKMLRMLKKLGCIHLDFGVESGSQRILDDIIHKQITIEQVRKVFKLCKKIGIRTNANFIIGFPTETISEMNMTLKLAKSIKPDFTGLTIATPLPGTDLEKMVGPVDPQDYFRLEFFGTNYSNKYNKSEVRDLNSVHARFVKDFNMINLRGFLKDIPFYIYLWFKLPRKISRFLYISKKTFNFFIFRPIIGKSLRL